MPSEPSSGSSPHTRRLLQADAAAKDLEGSEVDALAVAWPVLSFRPTPRSKRRPAQEPNKQLASSDVQPLQPAPPAPHLPSLKESAVPADAASASSSEEEEDWSYPALDLTASQHEAAQRMQAKAAGTNVLEDNEYAPDAAAQEAHQPVHTEAPSNADSASDVSSDHEDWSYPPMQPSAPPDRRQAGLQGNGHRHDADDALSSADDNMPVSPDAPPQDAAKPRTWTAAALVRGSGSADCLQPQPAFAMHSQPTHIAQAAHLHVMFSNAAYDSARPSTGSEEDEGIQQESPEVSWQPADSLESQHDSHIASSQPPFDACLSATFQETEHDLAQLEPLVGSAAAGSLQDAAEFGCLEPTAGSHGDRGHTHDEVQISFEQPSAEQSAHLSTVGLFVHEDQAEQYAPCEPVNAPPQRPTEHNMPSNPIHSFLSHQLPSLGMLDQLIFQDECAVSHAQLSKSALPAIADSTDHTSLRLRTTSIHSEQVSREISALMPPSGESIGTWPHSKPPSLKPIAIHTPDTRGAKENGPLRQMSKMAALKHRLLPRTSSAAAHPHGSLKSASSKGNMDINTPLTPSQASIWAKVTGTRRIKAGWTPRSSPATMPKNKS